MAVNLSEESMSLINSKRQHLNILSILFIEKKLKTQQNKAPRPTVFLVTWICSLQHEESLHCVGLLAN